MSRRKSYSYEIGDKSMKQSDKTGAALFVVLGVMIVLTLSFAGVLRLAMQHYYTTQGRIDFENAFYAAESGLEAATIFFAYNFDDIPNNFSSNGIVGNATYSYKITRTGRLVCNIYAEGTTKGKTRAVEMTGVRNETFARFAFWSKINGEIYFAKDEKFFGHIHTDDIPWFKDNPEFFGKVTTAAKKFTNSSNNSTNNVKFHDGFYTNRKMGEMAEVNFDKMKGLAEGTKRVDRAQIFEGKTDIKFDNKKMYVRNEKRKWSTWHELDIADDQFIYVKNKNEGNLTIYGGTLDGRVTLVSENTVYIAGHLVYANDPLKLHDGMPSLNALGIISGKDVMIINNTPKNLNLHATIMATGKLGGQGSFYVYNYANRDKLGFINLIGGIVQQKRGAVGLVDGTGYKKNYIFDARFETVPPPFFPPIEGRVTFTKWVEVAPRKG